MKNMIFNLKLKKNEEDLYKNYFDMPGYSLISYFGLFWQKYFELFYKVDYV